LQDATYGANPDALNISKLTNTVTLNISLASMALVPGSNIVFDVYTSGGGGGDSAVDALGNNSQTIADWGNPYNSGTNTKTYVVTPVPEPVALGLLAMGAVGLLRRRRAA
jgi:MYXO-CTERM domain-containing protein